MLTRRLLPAVVVALALAVAACGDDAGDGGAAATAPPGAIEVSLFNWGIEAARDSVPAGTVTFWTVHDAGHAHGADEGGLVHDLQVFRKTPGGGFELVGQVQGLEMGEAEALTLDLEPGDYELACNVVEDVGGTMVAHYAKGMHAPFTVTA